jgi:hypothetical protein
MGNSTIWLCLHLRESSFLSFPWKAKMPSSQILFEGNVDIVPMPGWLSFIGVSRFLIAFVTIALVTATTPIWGSFTAFGLSLFTVSLTCAQRLRHTDDLPACGDPLYRGYYRLALGYKPLLYIRWAILGLATFGVIFWLECLVLLAKWTAMYNNSIYWDKTYLSYLPCNVVRVTKRALLLRTSPGQYHAGVIWRALGRRSLVSNALSS